MGVSSSVKYAYIVARVRAMKGKLIPKDMYPKFLNMEIPEITRFIEESDYKKDVDELGKKYTGTDLIEHALNQNLALTYRKLIEVSQNEANYLITEYLRFWDIWNIKTILKNHKAHTDTDINPDRQDKTSSSFPPEMEKISLSRFFWGVGGGPGGQEGFGKELMVWNCI